LVGCALQFTVCYIQRYHFLLAALLLNASFNTAAVACVYIKNAPIIQVDTTQAFAQARPHRPLQLQASLN
jgi:hypothetical protein